jgi:uncharacterized protein (DUF1778 family)
MRKESIVVQTPSKPAANRDQAINIRATRSQRDLIDRAAELAGRSRSDFMLESAYQQAMQVLLDQVYFQVDEHRFEQFQELLDNPPPASDELRRLLHTPAPWE